MDAALVAVILRQLLLFSTGNNTEYMFENITTHVFHKYNAHELTTTNTVR